MKILLNSLFIFLMSLSLVGTAASAASASVIVEDSARQEVEVDECPICMGPITERDPAITCPGNPRAPGASRHTFHRECMIRARAITPREPAKCLLCTTPWPELQEATRSRLSFWDAVKYGDLSRVNELLAAGADVNAANNNGETALMCAAFYGNDHILDVLLDVDGINVNTRDNNGKTALMHAAICGHSDCVSSLLSVEEIDVNARDNNGDTALTHASFCGYHDVVSWLLAADGINVNAANNAGSTALMYAVFKRHSNVIRSLLVVDDIDVDVTNNNGVTALMIALHFRRDDVVLELIKKTALKRMGRWALNIGVAAATLYYIGFTLAAE